MKGGFLDTQDILNPSKPSADGIAGCNCVLQANSSLSSFDAWSLDTRKHLLREAAQWEDPETTAPEEELQSWAAPGQ